MLCVHTKEKNPRNRDSKVLVTEFVYAVWIESNLRILQVKEERVNVLLQKFSAKVVVGVSVGC